MTIDLGVFNSLADSVKESKETTKNVLIAQGRGRTGGE